MNIEQRVKEIVAEQSGLELEMVTNESTLDDLGLDELDAMEVVLELEDEYDIEIDTDVIGNLDTIQGFVDLVTNLKVAQSHITNKRRRKCLNLV